MLIEVSQAVFGYGQRRVVQVDHLELAEGRCLGMVGTNGAGKTTLLRGISGLLRPLTGEVRSCSGLRIGYVPQRQTMDPRWPMTALDAAALAPSAWQRLGWLGRTRGRILEAMGRLGVEKLAGKSYAVLSGGQQQRVLLAGALAAQPHLLMLDEPTDGLDRASRLGFLALLRTELGRGMAMVMISHDVGDLAALTDEIAWLEPGPDGSPSRVLLMTATELRQRALEQGVGT